MAIKSKPAATKKPRGTGKAKPGRKPNLYVALIDGESVEGPFTSAELTDWLGTDETFVDGIKVYKLDHEVAFRRVPARVEIQNGSG